MEYSFNTDLHLLNEFQPVQYFRSFRQLLHINSQSIKQSNEHNINIICLFFIMKVLEVCIKVISYLTILIFNQCERIQFCHYSLFVGRELIGASTKKIFYK